MSYIVRYHNPQLSISVSVIPHGTDYGITVKDDAADFVFQSFFTFGDLPSAIDAAKRIAGL